MGETTFIEWADATWNTAWGCTKVGDENSGCSQCYMFRLSKQFGKSTEFTPRKLDYILRDIDKFKDPRIIFTNSMTDTFHENASFELIESWFKIMEQRKHLQFIILTKRINKALQFFKTRLVPDNCWIGTSIARRTDLHRLQTLRKIQAKIRFVSFEPLLEHLYEINLAGINWVIVGGESDYFKPREFKEEWAINIRNQCKSFGIPFFFKQTGGRAKNERGVWGSDILDGQRYLEMPMQLHTKESSTLDQKIQAPAQTLNKFF